MPPRFDTLIAAHLINENLPVDLQDVGSRTLGVTNWGKGIISFGQDDEKPPSPLWGEEGMGKYNARDTGYSHLIFQKEAPRIKENQTTYNLMKHLIMPGLQAVLNMEMNGIWVNRERLERRNAVQRRYVDMLERKLLQLVPQTFRDTINPNNKKKWFENDNFIRKWFFGLAPDGLGLTAKYFTDKTKEAKVDKKSLSYYTDHETVKLYLKLNDFNTQLKFFLQWFTYMDSNDRLHPSFNLAGTVTGRRSCANPNQQQVPRAKYIRSIIGAPPGWIFLEVDYSQIEVRLVAWFAREDTMMDIFRKGGDIYRYTAAQVLKISEEELTEALVKGQYWAKEARQKAKAMVLGFLYGMSAGAFGEYAKATYNVEFTEKECIEFRNEFFKTYPGLIKWHEECKLIARRKFEIHSIMGRVRHLLGVLSAENYERGKAERQAINSPVQGTGADFILMGLWTLHNELDPREVMLVGDIHDALLVQIREEVWEKWATHILDRIENPPGLKKFNITPPIPIVAEAKIGFHWGEGMAWRPGIDISNKLKRIA